MGRLFYGLYDFVESYECQASNDQGRLADQIHPVTSLAELAHDALRRN